MSKFPACRQQGFSLIQVSILLLAAGLAMVAVLPGGKGGSDPVKDSVTFERMKAIETATKQFMTTNMRRPCPASGTYAVSNVSFGIEMGVAGACATADFVTGSVVASAVAGTVPVRALGLPDEYEFDGYGRRFMYIVDKNATSTAGCRTYQSQESNGLIEILKDTASTSLKERTMWALISYGKDGHGAFSGSGSTVDNRINTYTTDSKTLVNAFVDSSFVTAFTGQVINASAQTGFDDKVWYNDATKNTCCIGPRCSQGFRIDTNATAVEPMAGVQFATGDINGDGIKDLVYANDNAASNEIKVILGTQSSLPVAPTAMTGSTAATYTIDNDLAGAGTFIGASIAVGDATGDGKDDILINSIGYAYFIHNLAAAAPGTYAISALQTATRATQITTGGTVTTGAVRFGNVDGDSYKDLIIMRNLNSHYVFVLYGKADASWPATLSNTIATALAANGFYLYSASATAWCGYYNALAAANINQDVTNYDEIICGGPSGLAGLGAVSLIYGKARASWPAGDCPGTCPVVNVDAAVTTLGSGAYFWSNAGDTILGQTLDVADINNDGYPDIAVASSTRIYGVKGKSANYVATGVNLAVALAANVLFKIDTSTNRPAAFVPTGTNNVLSLGDVNGDSLPDILFGTQGSTYEHTTSGVTYVFFQPTTTLGWGSTGYAYALTPLFGANPNEYQYFNGVKGFLIEGATADQMSTVKVADINKDGKNDILLAAPGNGGSSGGSIYVIYGRDTVPWMSRYHTSTLNPYINVDDINF